MIPCVTLFSAQISATDLSQKESSPGFVLHPTTIWDSSFLMTSAVNSVGKKNFNFGDKFGNFFL
jgi:hypothetical protein